MFWNFMYRRWTSLKRQPKYMYLYSYMYPHNAWKNITETLEAFKWLFIVYFLVSKF